MKKFDTQDLIKHFNSFESICNNWDPINRKISFKQFTNKENTLDGIGPKLILRQNILKVFDYKTRELVSIEQDFAGLYLFSKNGKPFYCGISRNVIKRILDHQKGSTSSMATLAHRIAKNADSDLSEEKYLEAFNSEKKNLLECDISLIKLYDQDREAHKVNQMAQHNEEIKLYLFEVFVSVKYNTEHNTFRTH